MLGRFGLQPAEVREFGARRDDPQHNHGDDQLCFATRFGGNESIESDFSQRAKDGSDMSMREATNDIEVVVFGGEWFTGEPFSDDLDQIVGQIGEVSDGEMFDLSVFAEGMSQEMGDIGLRLVLFRDGGDMNGSFVGAHA